MSTKVKEVQKQNVTITPKDGDIGMSFEAEVLLHMHDVDGSQIIVLKTDRRESVEQFLDDELVAK